MTINWNSFVCNAKVFDSLIEQRYQVISKQIFITVYMYVLQLYDSNSMYVVFCSLLKVHLQLRGFSVFLDIEKLKAGKFDENLLSSVKLAKNFILVLTPNALDRCMGDDEQNDWVHKVC